MERTLGTAGPRRNRLATKPVLERTNCAGARRKPSSRSAEVALDDPALCAHLAAALATLNAGQGSAGRVERLLLLDTPPDMDAGEITDKGYVNQRAVLARRAEAVERLYAEAPDAAVIVAAG